jgi:tetratricopeptide (TPR) repeat protein
MPTREESASLDPAETALRRQMSQAAQAAIDSKDWEGAKLALHHLLARMPKSAEAHQRLGRVFQAQGQLPSAEAEYRQALTIDPEYIDALIGLGEVEAARGRLHAALTHIQAAIEVNPRRPQAQLAQARVMESLGRTDEALAAYFRALKYDGTSPEALLRVATIQLDRGQPDQALPRLTQVLELAPNDAEARHQRGRAHLALRHVPEAIDDLRFAAREQPGRWDVFYQLALALELAHNAPDALRAAQQAASLNPNNAAARELSTRLRR